MAPSCTGKYWNSRFVIQVFIIILSLLSVIGFAAAIIMIAVEQGPLNEAVSETQSKIDNAITEAWDAIEMLDNGANNYDLQSDIHNEIKGNYGDGQQNTNLQRYRNELSAAEQKAIKNSPLTSGLMMGLTMPLTGLAAYNAFGRAKAYDAQGPLQKENKECSWYLFKVYIVFLLIALGVGIAGIFGGFGSSFIGVVGGVGGVILATVCISTICFNNADNAFEKEKKGKLNNLAINFSITTEWNTDTIIKDLEERSKLGGDENVHEAEVRKEILNKQKEANKAANKALTNASKQVKSTKKRKEGNQWNIKCRTKEYRCKSTHRKCERELNERLYDIQEKKSAIQQTKGRLRKALEKAAALEKMKTQYAKKGKSYTRYDIYEDDIYGNIERQAKKLEKLTSDYNTFESKLCNVNDLNNDNYTGTAIRRLLSCRR